VKKKVTIFFFLILLFYVLSDTPWQLVRKINSLGGTRYLHVQGRVVNPFDILGK